MTKFNAYDPLTGAVFIPKLIPAFYQKRYCPYCEREMEVINAIHNEEHQEIFKAVYICENPKCSAYDRENRQCYIRIYYSCEDALEAFETIFLRFERIKKS